MTEKWENCREELFEEMIAREVRVLQCIMCQSETAQLRCQECGGALCSECDENIHLSRALHDREAFVDGFYQPVPPKISLDGNGDLKTVSKWDKIIL